MNYYQPRDLPGMLTESQLSTLSTPASASSDPEPSQPSHRTMETMPEPTEDRVFPPAVTKEPARITALTIALELKPSSESDQVCELATSVPLGVLV